MIFKHLGVGGGGVGNEMKGEEGKVHQDVDLGGGIFLDTSLLNPHKMYVRHIVIYFMKLSQRARRGHHFLPLYRPAWRASY